MDGGRCYEKYQKINSKFLLSLQQTYWSIRRKILKKFVPEFIWPKESNIDGVAFKIRSTPYSYGTKKGLQSGQYEVCERQLLKGQIKSGDIIVEMGGSIGVLTAIMAQQAGEKGLVISIEASKAITGYSKPWLEAKGNIKVITGFGFPVYSLNKKISIHSFDEEAGSLGGTLNFDVLDETAGSDITVFDIQKIMQQYHISPTVLVADVEGSEKIITSVKPSYPLSVRMILMEMHEHMYGIATRDAIISAIKEDGFRIKDHIQGVYLFERA